MNVCGSAFTGIGLLDYGLALAGWKHAFLCESEADRRAILHLRWPGVPVYEDVRDIDGAAPRIDLFAFGFPCRGASTAGLRTGLDHPETALWREAARVIRILRPRLTLVENVANLLAVRDGQAWAEVLGDLASLGYVFAWDCLPAAAFGAPHLRDRVFLVAAHAAQLDQRVAADEAHPESGSRDAREVAGGRDSGAPAHASNGGRRSPERDVRAGQPDAAGLAFANASSPNGQGAWPGREALGRAQPNDPIPAPDSERVLHGRSRYPDDAGETGTGEGEASQRQRIRPDLADVDWGTYGSAIRRWEEAHGPAPEPLLRGVDDRGSRKVVRSRLSALGDGVQVQAGHYLGERLMELQAQQKAAA